MFEMLIYCFLEVYARLLQSRPTLVELGGVVHQLLIGGLGELLVFDGLPDLSRLLAQRARLGDAVLHALKVLLLLRGLLRRSGGAELGHFLSVHDGFSPPSCTKRIVNY